jgi:hypothetical protein
VFLGNRFDTLTGWVIPYGWCAILSSSTRPHVTGRPSRAPHNVILATEKINKRVYMYCMQKRDEGVVDTTAELEDINIAQCIKRAVGIDHVLWATRGEGAKERISFDSGLIVQVICVGKCVGSA